MDSPPLSTPLRDRSILIAVSYGKRFAVFSISVLSLLSNHHLSVLCPLLFSLLFHIFSLIFYCFFLLFFSLVFFLLFFSPPISLRLFT